MEKFDIFDTHVHLDADDFAGREAEGLAPAREIGVTRHNVIGFDVPTIKRVIELAEKSPEIYATIGWYPTEAGSCNQKIEDMVVASLSHPKVIGLGGIGLGYHWMKDPKDVQMEVLKHQIQLPKDHNLPSIIHTHGVLEGTHAVIKETGAGPRNGIIHSFLGPLEMAEYFIGLGIMIPSSRIVTSKRALGVQEVAQRLPLDKTLVETDAPYLAPVPKRGHGNRVAYTRYVVDKIVELRGLISEEAAKATSGDVKRLFNCD